MEVETKVTITMSLQEAVDLKAHIFDKRTDGDPLDVLYESLYRGIPKLS